MTEPEVPEKTLDPTRTCAACPSYLTAEEAVSKFKKSIGAPMCGRYGKVLGRPGASADKLRSLQTHIANNCNAFGKDALPTPLTFDFKVALPAPDTIGREINLASQEACKSCASCINFIRDDVVASELGWGAGLCAATGRLIMPNRHVIEAKGCVHRQFGRVRTTTDGIYLLPEYEDAFQLTVDPIKAYFKSVKEFVEPHDWPTDKPVAEADQKSGIRAWRRVLDPDGSGNQSFLPIYDPEHFTPEERAKIPRTGDDEHPELYVDHFGGVYLAAVTWTELDETPALWGAAGSGKTELFRHLAWLMCLPFERISITGDTEIDELAGKMHFSPDKGTYFQYGRLPLAWMKPCVVCIDEPNVGQPPVWQFIRPLTDNSKQLVLDMNESERLDRHQDCYMGMAMNPPWDAKNVGTQQIGDADANRLFHVYIELPPPELEREIIRKRVALDGWEIDEARLSAIMSIAREIRGLAKEGTLPISWMIRPQIKVARATRWFDMVTAYRRTAGDYLEPEACAALLDIVRAHSVSN